MGQEKVEAAALSAQAMAWEAASFPQQFGMQLFQNMVATSADMMRMATRISTGSANTLPAQMARQAMTDSAALGLQMTNSTARLLTSGLRPVHSRATANAKRLGKFKWRPAKR